MKALTVLPPSFLIRKTEQNKQRIMAHPTCCLSSRREYTFPEFNAGDVVKVTSSIFGAPFDTEPLQKASDEKRVLWLVGDDIQLHEIVRNDMVLYNSGVKTVIEPVEK